MNILSPRCVMTALLLTALFGSTPLFAADATTAPTTQPLVAKVPTDEPHARMTRKGDAEDAGWMKRHDGLVELAKKGGIDLYFEGDSITDFWSNPRRNRNGASATAGLKVWNDNFLGWHPGNFGISADRTEHVLYRLEHGELDGVYPKAVVLMIGTNNSNNCTSEEIAAGVTAIVNKFKSAEPQAKILLLAIFPRGATPADKARQVNEGANKILAKLDDGGKTVKFLDFNDKFLTADGTLTKEIMPDLLHPSEKGYEIWAEAIKPTLTEWLGQPAAVELPTAPAGDMK